MRPDTHTACERALRIAVSELAAVQERDGYAPSTEIAIQECEAALATLETDRRLTQIRTAFDALGRAASASAAGAGRAGGGAWLT